MSFRLDDILAALDMTAPALRRWIYAGLVGNTASKLRKGALEFSNHDLAVLALVKPMTEFGLPVSAAHKVAVRALRDHAGPWAENEPLSAWWTAWAPTTQISVTRKMTEGGKPAWGLTIFEDADDTDWTAPAQLSLNPHRIIRETFERAVESADARVERRA